MFGGRVQAHVGRWQEAEHRADVDDAPAALLAHLRQYRLGNAQDAEDVGVEQRLGLADGGFLRRPEQRDAGIVDQYVDASGLGDDLLDTLVD